MAKRPGHILMEISIVIGVVMMLALIFIPQYQEAVDQAKAMEVPAYFATIATGQYIYSRETGHYASVATPEEMWVKLDFSTINSDVHYFAYETYPDEESGKFWITARVIKAFGNVTVGAEAQYSFEKKDDFKHPHIIVDDVYLGDYLLGYMKTMNGKNRVP